MNNLLAKFRPTLLVLLFIFIAHCCFAEITLPALWSDHVVVQRNLPVHVWGMAAPDEKVSVQFRGATASVTADEFGRWSVNLPPGDAGGPFQIQIQGTNRIVLNDILVGDVWLASGQSNMELQTKYAMHAEDELKAAQYPRIRLFHVNKRSSDFPQSDVSGTAWTLCTPQTVADFSGVAYFFGRDIQQDQHVPIGLIEADWGGTPGETWVSLTALSAGGALSPVWSNWANMSEQNPDALLEQAREARLTKAALAAGKPAPKFPWHPEFRSWLPGGAFNGMIAPLVPFPIRGVIWYQGESNAGPERSFYYARLFRTLIQDWRTQWATGNFPFLYVQIANFNTAPDDNWPQLRDAQRRTLNVANTGMAVTIDIGDPNNIHPKNKQEVGRRLSLAARALAYHETLEYSGPLYRTLMTDGSSIRVYFDHAASGLKTKGGALTGFEIAGKDGKFVPASARIDGDTVIVTSPNVSGPTAVRYGWSGNPQCNLYNRDDLPASPFSSLTSD